MNFLRRWLIQRRERNCKQHKHSWTAEKLAYRPQMEIVKCRYCPARYIVMKRK